MNKNLTTILKEWMLFTLYWVLIMAFLWPLLNLLLGLCFELFPSYVNAGKAFFTVKSILDSFGKGALMGFLYGSIAYIFTRVFSSQSIYKH